MESKATVTGPGKPKGQIRVAAQSQDLLALNLSPVSIPSFSTTLPHPDNPPPSFPFFYFHNNPPPPRRHLLFIEHIRRTPYIRPHTYAHTHQTFQDATPSTMSVEARRAFTSATRTLSASSLRERLVSLKNAPLRPVAQLHANIGYGVSPLFRIRRWHVP